MDATPSQQGLNTTVTHSDRQGDSIFRQYYTDTEYVLSLEGILKLLSAVSMDQDHNSEGFMSSAIGWPDSCHYQNVWYLQRFWCYIWRLELQLVKVVSRSANVQKLETNPYIVEVYNVVEPMFLWFPECLVSENIIKRSRRMIPFPMFLLISVDVV